MHRSSSRRMPFPWKSKSRFWKPYCLLPSGRALSSAGNSAKKKGASVSFPMQPSLTYIRVSSLIYTSKSDWISGSPACAMVSSMCLSISFISRSAGRISPFHRFSYEPSARLMYWPVDMRAMS